MKTAARNFSTLSVRDLIEAREHYHVHLTNKENVVATAIGKFLIRKTDPDCKDPKKAVARDPHKYCKNPPRTLANSVATPWSWPCVLVFVKAWLSPEQFAEKMDQAVPRFLYLPDGRVIPTCVVLVEPTDSGTEALTDLRFPDQLMGGGFPVLSDVQGSQHVGSIGCLVTDGNITYALTNRHVAGPPGAASFAIIDRERKLLGVSDTQQLAKQTMDEVYAGYPTSHAVVNLDSGLIRVDDVNEWTAQVYGIGELGELVDLNPDTISLDLIGTPVKAFGGASGLLEGEVQALFYRYQALGGMDYITDFLIGSRDPRKPLATRHGDSGTLWFIEEMPAPVPAATKGKAKGQSQGGPPPPPPRLRPFALQWGGHRFLGGAGEGQFRFALASNLSAICRLLDVEIIRDWNRGLPEYWGQFGHYKIGFLACGMLSSAKLKKLFTANAANIGISDDELLHDGIKRLQKDVFVPLADVPDDVWRNLPARNADANNHFADMDQPGDGEFAGKTLLDLCEDDANVDVAVWNRFYKSIHSSQHGAVPFRVWQIYDAMVGFVRAREIDKFVCAAGVLGHYVGDCGQPLHISMLHHGRPGKPSEKNVHSVYETNMLNQRGAELIAGLEQAVKGKTAKASVTGGKGAALALIQVMRKTIATLPPMDVIDAFNGASGQQRVPHMWDELGDRTITCITNATLFLATLWESAWKEGGGNKTGANAVKESDLVEIDRGRLRELYMDTDFIHSFTLQQMEAKHVLG